MTYPSTIADQFMVRMPVGMRPAIKRQAKENQRSMNAEIIYLIKKGMENRHEANNSA